MADTGAPDHPTIFVTGWGAPPGSVYVHCEHSGRTMLAPAEEAGYLAVVRELSREEP